MLQCGNVSPCTANAAGTETRSFSYDGLGRLLKSVEPESGTINYSYYPVGTLYTRTDARGEVSTYSYDQLNRVRTISYSGSYPAYTRTFNYDEAGHGYSWGHLTSVTNSTAALNYVSISPLEQVTASSETTGGGTYNFSYYYNLAGALVQENYPSGRVVKTNYDGANRVSGVAGTLGATTNYVTNATYWPHGGVEKEYFANNVVRTYTFNNRLQVNGLWDAIYDNGNYFLYLQNPIGYGTTNNNGNIQNLTWIVSAPGQPGVLTSGSQSFSYDGLNRLQAASDSGG